MEAVSVWSVRWDWATEPEILCGACMDERNEVARQTTGRYMNYDGPELVTYYEEVDDVEYDDPTPEIAPTPVVMVETCEDPK